MNRYIKIGLLLIFAATICLTSGKIANYEIFAAKQLDKVETLSDSTKYFAEIVENFAYFEYDKSNERYNLYDKSGSLNCYVLQTHPFCSEIRGFGGEVPFIIVFSPDNKIKEIFLLPNKETPSWINRLNQEGFLNSWNGKTAEEALNTKVDAVSGATFSSTAILKSIKLRLEMFAGSEKTSSNTFSTNNLIGFCLSFLYLIFAIICFWKSKLTSKYRIWMLLASVGILGFWQGEFISIKLLSGWLISGINWELQLFLFVVLIISIAIPIFTNKSFYCNYICPFGACQELIGKINKRKFDDKGNLFKILRCTRYVLLITTAVILCISIDISIEYLEPFSAFKIQYASLSVLILAGVMLILSLFVNRPWCRYFCPTGAFFSLFKQKKTKK